MIPWSAGRVALLIASTIDFNSVAHEKPLTLRPPKTLTPLEQTSSDDATENVATKQRCIEMVNETILLKYENANDKLFLLINKVVRASINICPWAGTTPPFECYMPLQRKDATPLDSDTIHRCGVSIPLAYRQCLPQCRFQFNQATLRSRSKQRGAKLIILDFAIIEIWHGPMS